MMSGGYGRSGNQHSPVAVKRENRERAKYMEVRFDAAICNVNQNNGHQDLGNRKYMPGEMPAGMAQGQKDGRNDEEWACQHGRQQMGIQR